MLAGVRMDLYRHVWGRKRGRRGLEAEANGGKLEEYECKKQNGRELLGFIIRWME